MSTDQDNVIHIVHVYKPFTRIFTNSSHFLHFPSFSKHIVNQLQSTTSFLKLIFPSYFLINFYHDRIISFLFYTSFNYVVIYNGDLRYIIWPLLQLLLLFKTIICLYSHLPTYNPSLVKHVFYQSLDVSSFPIKLTGWVYWMRNSLRNPV